MRRTIAGLGSALLVASVALPAAATPPSENTDGLSGGHKVTICHRTSSSDPANGWVVITVDIASSGGLRSLANHMHHTYDVNDRGRSDFIPAYSYAGEAFGPYFHEESPTPDEYCEGQEPPPNS